MEILIILLFCAGLGGCLLAGFSVLYALLFGLALFLLYGRWKKLGWRSLVHACLEGVLQARSILIVFILIGVLTAMWRSAGTIPVIVTHAASLISPPVYLLMTFLLNCGVSLLTGTSFGTGATMGAISATMGYSLGVDPRLVGGAVLAGVFFGDRCSPVSTSALLVAQQTGTDIYNNIRRMLRTALLPFLAACLLYLFAGLKRAGTGQLPDLKQIFSGVFSMHPAAALPALVILVLALLRVNVKLAMTASILTAALLSVTLQHMKIAELFAVAVRGFYTEDPAAAAMINGGGVVSMLRGTGIVCISSCYAGLFRETGLLDGVRGAIERLAGKTNSYTAILLTSLVTGMISCNQTLSIMLCAQLCHNPGQDADELAIDLEDSAVVTAALVPWSIASTVPLGAIGAPATSIPFAFFLYLLPIWRVFLSFLTGKRKKPVAKQRVSA